MLARDEEYVPIISILFLDDFLRTSRPPRGTLAQNCGEHKANISDWVIRLELSSQEPYFSETSFSTNSE